MVAFTTASVVGSGATAYYLSASGTATRAESCLVGFPCSRDCAVLISQNADFMFVESTVERGLKILCCVTSATGKYA